MSRRLEDAFAELKLAYDEDIVPAVVEARKWKLAAQERDEQLTQARADISNLQRENAALRARMVDLERFHSTIAQAVRHESPRSESEGAVARSRSSAAPPESPGQAFSSVASFASSPSAAAPIRGQIPPVSAAFASTAPVGFGTRDFSPRTPEYLSQPGSELRETVRSRMQSTPEASTFNQQAQRLYREVERNLGPQRFREFAETVDAFNAGEISVEATIERLSRLLQFDKELLARGCDLIYQAEDAALSRIATRTY